MVVRISHLRVCVIMQRLQSHKRKCDAVFTVQDYIAFGMQWQFYLGKLYLGNNTRLSPLPGWFLPQRQLTRVFNILLCVAYHQIY